ncbi:ribosomal protein L24 [Gracilaria domingensis]|nr:ribosomal protein L24 [Gracilaria domingensis]
MNGGGGGGSCQKHAFIFINCARSVSLAALSHGHFVGALLRRGGTALRSHALLPLLDVLESGLARSLSHLGTLVTLRLDDLERGTLDGLRGGRDLSARAATLRLLLHALLVEAAVQLRPRVLGGLALHVERRLGLGVDEHILASVDADVAATVSGVDAESGVVTKLGSAGGCGGDRGTRLENKAHGGRQCAARRRR